MEETPTTAQPIAYDELGELYDEWCAGVVEDVPFYVALAGALAGELGRPLHIVELGAGSGRISLPLAAAGNELTCIDVATAQLQRLEQRAAVQGLAEQVTIVAGDMRDLGELVAPGSCDLVIAPFRALLHVTADRDRVLASVRRALAPGGAVAFDVFHPGPDAAAAMDGEWLLRRRTRTAHGRWRFEERATLTQLDPDRAAAVPRTRIDLEVRCTFERSRTPARLRRGDRSVGEPQPGEPGVRLTRMQLEAVPAHEWLATIERAGLVLDGAYGWFDGRPLEAGDDDSAWVARAPVD